LNTQSIEIINEAIRHHTDFPSNSHKRQGYYLSTMDMIALAYNGTTASERLSNTLKEYYKAIGVNNLSEAINYVVEIDKNKLS